MTATHLADPILRCIRRHAERHSDLVM